ncbi:hypothetical protein DM02DRAFT_582806 [Periconia macrospinosa]|uniref:Pinin/SDK/MemA protein domain-containing protein n=1 Tax=Periconia macrospinosa TaxID=97972 RepID=A0A2V1EAW8_9PLEO|nr:hypothetical protein DM02DRAFT_582806 [Periconia macrospinosa]
MDAIASAVVLPDAEPSPPPSASSPPGTKRRQSSLSEQDAKRARLDDVGHSTQRRDSASKSSVPAPELATAPKARERGRERRLFGAALGALSQNSATAGQKRRLEIEKRQQAQRKLEVEESEQRKAERLAKCKAQRWREQAYFDKSSMRLRHDNLLAMAHFLKTTTEPQLLYKPWETTAEEDDRIRKQIAEAHEIIRQEVKDYSRQRDAERSQAVSREEKTDQPDQTKQVSQSGKETTMQGNATANGSPTDDRVSSPINSEHLNGFSNSHLSKVVSEKPAGADNRQSEATSHQPSTEENNREAVDETGEEVVEAAEDTVIY